MKGLNLTLETLVVTALLIALHLAEDIGSMAQ